jgi:hypothetical protein
VFQQLLKETQDRAAEEEWDNFINCTHLPDVRKESEISTYMALWYADWQTVSLLLSSFVWGAEGGRWTVVMRREEDHDTDLERILKETQQAIDVTIDLYKLVSQAMVQPSLT